MRTLLAVLLLALAALPALATGAEYRVTVETWERTAPQIEIKVAYPQLSNMPKAVADPFNARAKAEAEKRGLAFFAEALDVLGMPEVPKDWQLLLTTEVETKHVSPRLIVLLETGYEFTGGAHGTHPYSTIAVDALDGRDLEFQDMFKPGVDYLGTVSKIAIADLGKREQDLSTTLDWIQTGAGPEASNFQVFWPGDDGLHILFPDYQVAPYVAGASEVVIPYGALKGLLNDRYFD